MARNEIGSLRRSQVVGASGPGAIVDFRVGTGGATCSVVVAGLEEWDERSRTPGLGNPQVIYEPRLQQKLGVDGFRLPPVAPEVQPGVPQRDADVLVGVRFPMWQQCPNCHELGQPSHWMMNAGEPALYCGPCSDDLGGRRRSFVVPVRFIATCANGHLDEFPWHFWAQHDAECDRRRPLKLVGSSTAGLAGLMLECTGCGAERSMEGCFDPRAIKALGGCRGRRPWLAADPERCCEEIRIVQRGASNLYFPVVDSALDIPPWSDSIQKRLEQYWADLVPRSREERRQLIELLRLNQRLGMSTDALLDQIDDRVARLQNPTQTSLRYEEYRQFTEHRKPFGDQTEFELRPVQTPPELEAYLEHVTRATRLREVRSLRAFTRVHPPAGEHDARAAEIYVQPQRWLPAVENRGEGVFVQLRRDHLAEWEARADVSERAEGIRRRYVESVRGRTGENPDRAITARFLLIHGLAHALIRQFSIDCGYSGAALRERLYVESDRWDMGALLIYTASADSDGTLGGLARQGRPENLASAFERAIRSLSWCSSDPLCIESRISLSHQLNGAACHACLLASETSCEEFNILLDRALLVGAPSRPELGFFRDYLSVIQSRAA